MKVLVSEWFSYHLVRKPYPCHNKLEFETTNNVVEYEALVLGLRAAKKMGIKEVVVFRDAELIV